MKILHRRHGNHHHHNNNSKHSASSLFHWKWMGLIGALTPTTLTGAVFMESSTAVAEEEATTPCSLCSDGRSVPFPDLLVRDDDGNEKKRTCQSLQQRVAKRFVQNTDKCRNVQLRQGAADCHCPGAEAASTTNPVCNVCQTLFTRSGTGLMVNPLEFDTLVSPRVSCGDQVRMAAALQQQDTVAASSICASIQSTVAEHCPCASSVVESPILCSPLCKIYRDNLASIAVTEEATCWDFKNAMNVGLWTTSETCNDFHRKASQPCCQKKNLPPALEKPRQNKNEQQDDFANDPDCVDNVKKKAIYFGRRRNKFQRDCAWLATLKPKVVEWYCLNLVKARRGCLACTDNPKNGVDESRSLDVYEVRKRDCLWLQTRLLQRKKCNTSKQARQHCRRTCQTCRDDKNDDNDDDDEDDESN